LENVCDAVPNYDMQTVPEDFTAEVGNESCIYIQHVEGTAKQMIMENEW
jgi:hypothetical protein